ncbi:MAG: CoA ester lyase [Bacteroidota bacterium]
MSTKNDVMRTLLFVPGHIEKMLHKSLKLNADCIAFCLEDAVPEMNKVEAREKVKAFLTERQSFDKKIFVRINSIESGYTLLDLMGVACKQLTGFVYPMARTPDDIKNFDAQLSLIEKQIGLPKGYYSIIALIETPSAVLKSYDIAKSSDRVIALLFGCEDYMAEMDSRYSENEMSLFVPRSTVAMAARAAGIQAIDTPYVNIDDTSGLLRFATVGRDLGFTGMLVLSPKQIDIVKKCYTPSDDEVIFAKAVIEGEKYANEIGRGIVVIDNKFVSPPTIKQARRILKRYSDILEFESKKED